MDEKQNNIQVFKTVSNKIKITPIMNKSVLICMNGYQTMDTHDSTAMNEYFENNFKNDYPLCEIDLLLLFEPADVKTHNVKKMEKKIEDEIVKYEDLGYDIYILGYSFSCGLAAKMAYKHNKSIKKVILAAPINDILLSNMIPYYLKYVYKFYKFNKKYGAKVAKSIGRQTVKGMFGLLVVIFLTILKNRGYFKKITQDTLLLRGSEDLLCPKHSLKHVERKLHCNYNKCIYTGLTHSLLKTLKSSGIVFEDILNFAFSTPFLIDRVEKRYSYIKKEVPIAYDEDGDIIPTFAQIFDSIDPDGEKEYISQQSDL